MYPLSTIFESMLTTFSGPGVKESSLVCRSATSEKRTRLANSYKEARRAQSVPHGVAGAKLARKAMKGTVGKARIQ